MVTHNHMEFGRPHVNSVLHKADVKVFVKSESTSITSLEYVQKVKNCGTVITYFIYLQRFTITVTESGLNG